jgi:site-specific recombinase XerD
MMKHQNVSDNIDQVSEELKRRLTVLRYSESSAKRYLSIFEWLAEYVADYGETDYSEDIGERFLAEYLLQAHHAPSWFVSAKLVVNRLNEIINNEQFAPKFATQPPLCPPQYEKWRNAYLADAEQRGLKPTTIGNNRRQLDRLFDRFENSGVANLSELTASELFAFFTNHRLDVCMLSTAKSLFGFLFRENVTRTNLSVCVPKPTRPKPLPSVYTAEEVRRVFDAVDNTTSFGRRDYAIMRLASHLGLRSSDIANLSLGDIDYERKVITIVQTKTGRPVTLVLNHDVEDALTAYIQNGRPDSDSDKVFLKSQAPYTPICPGACYAVVHRYFLRAGIDTAGRKTGPHALRMSYATALVSKGVPYPIVTEALGHEDPESAKFYVRLDIRRLRTCALDVPKPSGALAMYLNDLEGVL